MEKLITEGMNLADITVEELADICFKLHDYEETELTPEEFKEMLSHGACGDSIIGSCNMANTVKEITADRDHWKNEAEKAVAKLNKIQKLMEG